MAFSRECLATYIFGKSLFTELKTPINSKNSTNYDSTNVVQTFKNFAYKRVNTSKIALYSHEM
jgi:hypothetical protein